MKTLTLTIAAALLLAAQPARAGGMAQSIEACRALQSSSIPLTCKLIHAEGQPMFMFAFDPAGTVTSEEIASLVLDVVRPACASQLVGIAFVTTMQGVSAMKLGLCQNSNIEFSPNWLPLEDTQ